MTNPAKLQSTQNQFSALHASAITPADADLATDEYPRGIYVGTTGNVAVRMAGDGQIGDQDVTFIGVPAGTLLPISVSRVLATGTTASNIVALY